MANDITNKVFKKTQMRKIVHILIKHQNNIYLQALSARSAEKSSSNNKDRNVYL